MAIPETKAIELLEKMEGHFKGEIKSLTDKVASQEEQIRELGGTNPETSKSIKEHEERLKSLNEGLEELKELAPQLREMKAAFDRPGGPSHKGRTSPGNSFVDSEEYKQFIENNEVKSETHNLGAMSNLLPESKALTSEEGMWGGAGLLIQPLNLGLLTSAPQRELRFRDLVNVQNVSTDSITYYQETGFANLFTVLTAPAGALATNIVVESVSGFFAGQTITVNGEVRVIAPNGINAATRTLTLTSGLAAPATIGAEVFSDHLAGTPHGGKKPEANIKFDDATASIITIAHWIAAHRQTLEDAPRLEGYVNSRLLFGLDLALEHQALYGTGTSQTLMGIFNAEGVQNQGQRAGNDPQGRPWTEIDWVRKALTKAQVAEYPVNGAMINPLNWENIELAKDADGRYLWVTVNEGGIRRLFGVPVSVTTAIRAGEFLLGAFGLGVTLFDRQRANIRVSDSHAEFFIQNALAILAELRVGMALFRPESLIKGKF